MGRKNRAKEYPVLDMIRFLSSIAIAVFLHYSVHFVASFGRESFLYSMRVIGGITAYSYLLVELFFMVSGFLFGEVYSRSIYDGKSQFELFIRGRLLRLWPMAGASTVSFFILEWLLYRIQGVLWSQCGSLSTTDLILNLLFMGTSVFNQRKTLNGNLWYLNVLLLCYCIAFFMVKVEKKYHTNIVAYCMVVIGIVVQVDAVSLPILNFDVSRGLIAFFIGYLIYKSGACGSRRWKMRAGGGLLAGFLFWGGLRLLGGSIDNLNLFVDILIYPPFLVACLQSKFLNHICGNKAIRYLGDVSYDIYVWNLPILLAIYMVVRIFGLDVDINTVWFLWVLLLIHFVIGSLSYLIRKGWVVKHQHPG